MESFEFTAELGAFDSLGIRLVHGWLVDPEEREAVRAPWLAGWLAGHSCAAVYGMLGKGA